MLNRKKILLYYPYNRRTIPIDVALQELINLGHEITLLTHQKKGQLHEIYTDLGCETYSMPVTKGNPLIRLLKRVSFVASFCKDKQINYVFSHLQEANMVCVFAQYFSAAKFFLFRHHAYYEYLLHETNLKANKNLQRGDKIVNFFANKIIVPSEGVKNHMINRENVKASKIKIIPYVYHFDKMLGSVDLQSVTKIKKEFSATLLLVMVSRMIPHKRHLYILSTINKLIKEGYDIKLLIMDDAGSEAKKINDFITEHRLHNQVKLLGFKRNILDYIAAAHILVHPSLTEASCSATKEAGLLQKLVVVAKGVGDFDDYIDNQSGASFDPNSYKEDLYKLITEVYNDKSIIEKRGEILKQRVINRFQLNDKTISLYINLMKNE